MVTTLVTHSGTAVPMTNKTARVSRYEIENPKAIMVVSEVSATPVPVVRLSRLFMWYGADFGDTVAARLRRIVPHWEPRCHRRPRPDAAMKTMWNGGALNRSVVAQSAETIGQLAGPENAVASGAQVLMVEEDGMQVVMLLECLIMMTIGKNLI